VVRCFDFLFSQSMTGNSIAPGLLSSHEVSSQPQIAAAAQPRLRVQRRSYPNPASKTHTHFQTISPLRFSETGLSNQFFPPISFRLQIQASGFCCCLTTESHVWSSKVVVQLDCVNQYLRRGIILQSSPCVFVQSWRCDLRPQQGCL
jgi:hypothetical protein